jgi:hypothetical protein
MTAAPRSTLQFRLPHTVVECANGDVMITLFEIKTLRFEKHLVEDQSCLTVNMKDRSAVMFFGKAETLMKLAEQLTTQVARFASFAGPEVRHTILPVPVVTITGEEER